MYSRAHSRLAEQANLVKGIIFKPAQGNLDAAGQGLSRPLYRYDQWNAKHTLIFVVGGLDLADELGQLPVPAGAVRGAVLLHAGGELEQRQLAQHEHLAAGQRAGLAAGPRARRPTLLRVALPATSRRQPRAPEAVPPHAPVPGGGVGVVSVAVGQRARRLVAVKRHRQRRLAAPCGEGLGLVEGVVVRGRLVAQAAAAQLRAQAAGRPVQVLLLRALAVRVQ